MLKLMSKASPRTCARIINTIATVAEKLGAYVVEDKDVNRFWIKTKRRQYIIASRFNKFRDPEIVYGNCKKGYHAGYISFWRGYNKELVR